MNGLNGGVPMNFGNSTSPIHTQEIASTGTPHTTSSPPIMIGTNSRNGSRRNSASYSYSAPNGSYIVTQPDISQYTAHQPMQQQLIRTNSNNINGSDLSPAKNPFIRLFQWYIAP